MIRQRLIFFIGLWVAFLPFLGFPKNLRAVLFVLTGLALIAISYFMYVQTKAIKEDSAPANESASKAFRKSKKRKIKKDPIIVTEESEEQNTQDISIEPTTEMESQ